MSEVASPTRERTTVHVVNHMAAGGIETLVLDLLRSASDHDPVVVFSLEGTTDSICKAWPVLRPFADRIIAFDAPAGRRFGIVPKLGRSVRRVGAHKVFLHHIGPLIYGGAAARLAGVRNVVHVEHDVWHYDRHPSHQRLLKWCARLLRPHHFAVSRPIANRLAELLPNARISVVPPGIDTARFALGNQRVSRQRLGFPIDAKIVGTVGRLTDVKAQHVLLEACAKLDPNVQVVLVGDGELRHDLEARAESLGLNSQGASRVHFLGHRDDSWQIYPAFDVFCLPSLNEGLPRVVMEAQACGVPVVASDVGAMRDAVCLDTGQLVAPGDPVTLATSLRDVMACAGDPARTRNFVMSHFDFSVTQQHYAQFGSSDPSVRRSSRVMRGQNA